MLPLSDTYDYLFTNVKPRAVSGIKIFNKEDSYLKPQRYEDVNNLENNIWAQLYQKQERRLDQYASKEYLLGLRMLHIPRDRFPEFEAISPLIENATGWTLLPVAGFLDEELFFQVNANRQFPVTDIIRHSPRFEEKYAGQDIQNDEGYTPEPDIFHDIQGHVPFLVNKDYARFMADMGRLGYRIIQNEPGLSEDLVAHNLKRLQNFAWWTYEFGLLKNTGQTDRYRWKENDIPYEIYGAGIISSYDETNNVIQCAKGQSRRSRFLPFDMEEIVLTRFDYSTIQDRYYVVDSMADLYQAFYDNQDLFFYRGD